MIPRQVIHKCPKCGHRQTTTQSCTSVGRVYMCPKCDTIMEVISTKNGGATAMDKAMDTVLNVINDFGKR